MACVLDVTSQVSPCISFLLRISLARLGGSFKTGRDGSGENFPLIGCSNSLSLFGGFFLYSFQDGV